MKTKITYSEVKTALKAGFISPLNNARTNYRLGEVFTIGSQQWEVTVSESISQHKSLKEEMLENGKDAFYFYARKVLRSGRISKQTGMFYRFNESGRFLKVL